MQTGWLSVDTLVELKLYEDSVKIWKKKHVGKNLFVKVTPVDANQSLSSFDVDENESLDVFETTEESKPWPIVNVAVNSFLHFLFHFAGPNWLELPYRYSPGLPGSC